ncbi:SH3 domain protein [Bacteriovorax sp. BSW11_IV]|uniref:SH3 domain-containing protein n=1 Tax=Bacteriovorax sp. BSW11_IV TaxID=1353529 RepID=UPI00038A0F1A|nr:SH3 domain-containing protein [Bacteriovorax sp. BSW11_IV]EQC45124.1 SH3 domain protein [Bacteriovorax sp. BSW11_IV]
MENTSTSDILKSLEELYLNGNYDEAMGLLIKNKSLFSNSDFHYNLGTILVKNNDLGAGRYNFEMALKESPFNIKARNNLDFLMKKLPLNDLSTSEVTSDKVINFSMKMGTDLVLSFSLILVLLLAILLRMGKITKKRIFALLVVLSLMPSGAHYFIKSKYKVAIALQNQKILEGPSGVYGMIGELAAGAKIILGEENKKWVMVEYPKQYAGWVKKDLLGNL